MITSQVSRVLATLLNGHVSTQESGDRETVVGVNYMGRLIITVIPSGQAITKEIAQIEAIIARIGE